MLVLSRKADEQIVIGDEIEITVLEVRGNRVKLGVSCPRDMSIQRSELIEIELSKSTSRLSTTQKKTLQPVA